MIITASHIYKKCKIEGFFKWFFTQSDTYTSIWIIEGDFLCSMATNVK